MGVNAPSPPGTEARAVILGSWAPPTSYTMCGGARSPALPPTTLLPQTGGIPKAWRSGEENSSHARGRGRPAGSPLLLPQPRLPPLGPLESVVPLWLPHRSLNGQCWQLLFLGVLLLLSCLLSSPHSQTSLPARTPQTELLPFWRPNSGSKR